MGTFYRLLLHLLPGAFRRRFGGAMEGLFLERLADAGTIAGRVRVVFGAIGDVVVHAVLEWKRNGAVDGRAAGVFSRGRMVVDGLRQDLRQSFRVIARSPSFSAIAIGTLALGIGATTAVFSVVYALLLRPLPYGDPGRLVAVWPEANFNKTMVDRVRESVPALESISGMSIWGATVTGEDLDPEEVSVGLVSANHFDVLKVKPALGRTFNPEESRVGSDVLILSHDYWAHRFRSDPSVLGRRIRMSVAGYDERTVIGVMPAGFRPVHPVDLAGWVPMRDTTGVTFATDNTWYVNWRVARLAQGASIEQATAQLHALALRLREEAEQNLGEALVAAAAVEPLQQSRMSDVTHALWLLLGAVSLVLLIACANVANLLLARGEARLRELSVRRALGAAAGRVARQLLTEAIVLALAGGVLGTLLAFALVRLIVAKAPDNLPDATSIAMNPVVLLFALGAAISSAVAFGIAPVVRARGARAVDALRQGSRSAVAEGGRSALSRSLVGAEVALAVLLVFGAGLMIRSLARMYAVDPGFQAEGLLSFRVTPPAYRYADTVAIRAFYRELDERLAAVPGIESVAGIQLLPVTFGNWSFGILAQGHEVPDGTALPSGNFRLVTAGYFETMRIPIVMGRSLLASDRDDALRVTVINEAMAEKFFPGEDPIGRDLRVFGSNSLRYTVVGIVGNVHQNALDILPNAEMYVPFEQAPWDATLFLVARVRGPDPLAVVAAVRATVRAVDRDAPVNDIATMEQVIGDSVGTTRFLTILLACFSSLALVLGAIGVYGVTAYTVARRVPEFGVRLALGASRRDVISAAGGRSLGPVIGGILIGTIAAFFAARILESLLFEIGPRDPLAFAGAPLVLFCVGTMASLLPALRACRVDPATVLRSD